MLKKCLKLTHRKHFLLRSGVKASMIKLLWIHVVLVFEIGLWFRFGLRITCLGILTVVCFSFHRLCDVEARNYSHLCLGTRDFGFNSVQKSSQRNSTRLGFAGPALTTGRKYGGIVNVRLTKTKKPNKQKSIMIE